MTNQPSKKYAVSGELLNHGSAHYQNEPEKNMSYFVDIKQDNGQVLKLWGVKLEEAMIGFRNGDKVNLIDNGLNNNVRQWECQYYEELKETNSIEKDEGIVLGKDVSRKSNHGDLNNKERTEQKEYQSVNYKVDDEEIKDEQEYFTKLPPSIKNNYEAIKVNKFLKDEKVNYYDKQNPSVIAFEDRNTSLNTSNSDEKTVNAMLDMAQVKGWKSIKLKGTEEFKRQMWLEAQLRGIETKGYNPKEEDLVVFKIKQAERTQNKIEQDVVSERDLVINIPKPEKMQTATELQKAPQDKQDNLFQEQPSNKNNRFNFEPMTAEDVGIGESEYLRQATHITDMETGEHYIIGNYDFESNGEVYSGVIAEYYVDDKALAERDDNALYGEERILYKLGINNQSLISHIDGDNKLTNEQLDKFLSLETLKDIVSNNQPIMPTTEFQVVSDVAKQAEFDNRELALAQTAMLGNYDVSWDRLDQHEKYERLALSVGDYEVSKQKYNRFIENLQKIVNQDLSYLKVEVKLDKTDQYNDIVAIAGYKKMISEKLKDNPELLVAKLNDVDRAIAEQTNFKAPEMPVNKIEPDVEIQKTQPSNQDRNR